MILEWTQLLMMYRRSPSIDMQNIFSVGISCCCSTLQTHGQLMKSQTCEVYVRGERSLYKRRSLYRFLEKVLDVVHVMRALVGEEDIITIGNKFSSRGIGDVTKCGQGYSPTLQACIGGPTYSYCRSAPSKLWAP